MGEQQPPVPNWEAAILVPDYSQRIAAMGSMRAAMIAGTSEAALAMMPRVATETSRIQGSRGEVS